MFSGISFFARQVSQSSRSFSIPHGITAIDIANTKVESISQDVKEQETRVDFEKRTILELETKFLQPQSLCALVQYTQFSGPHRPYWPGYVTGFITDENSRTVEDSIIAPQPTTELFQTLNPYTQKLEFVSLPYRAPFDPLDTMRESYITSTQCLTDKQIIAQQFPYAPHIDIHYNMLTFVSRSIDSLQRDPSELRQSAANIRNHATGKFYGPALSSGFVSSWDTFKLAFSVYFHFSNPHLRKIEPPLQDKISPSYFKSPLNPWLFGELNNVQRDMLSNAMAFQTQPKDHLFAAMGFLHGTPAPGKAVDHIERAKATKSLNAADEDMANMLLEGIYRQFGNRGC